MTAERQLLTLLFPHCSFTSDFCRLRLMTIPQEAFRLADRQKYICSARSLDELLDIRGGSTVTVWG